MRPTFMGFETATRGIMVNQKAMDIINNNIGNIGVDGYTRQRVDLSSMAINYQYTRYANYTVPLAGQGVTANGVSQIRNAYLDKRFREEYADVGFYDKSTEILTDLGAALDEIEPSNMTTALDNFKSAWNTLNMQDGMSTVAINTVLATARSLVQGFQQMNTKLNNVWEQQKYDLNVDVENVNSLLERIANLNDQIAKEVFSSRTPGNEYYKPNELLDAQNVLIDELSKYGNIRVERGSDSTVTIQMGAEGRTVVDGTSHEKLYVLPNPSTQTVSVNWHSTGKPAEMTTGSLKAYNDLLNGRGTAGDPNRGENFEQGVLYYKDKIDHFAEQLAHSFNTLIPIADADGNPTGDFKQLFSFSGDDMTAANITLNSAWANNPSYIIENIVQTGGVEDTAWVGDAINRFTDSVDFGEFKGSFVDYITFYSVARLSNQITFSQSRLESCTDTADSILDSIQDVSGVSMEEEGVDLMQYSKAFQAMSRVMTALDEALDVLINQTGTVGR